MPVYKAPVEDVLFLLNDVFGMERYNNLPGFADATPDMVEAILGEGANTSSQSLAPSVRIASTVSGVASAKPGRLLCRSIGKTSFNRNITSSTGAL